MTDSVDAPQSAEEPGTVEKRTVVTEDAPGELTVETTETVTTTEPMAASAGQQATTTVTVEEVGAVAESS